MPYILDSKDADFDSTFEAFLTAKRASQPQVQDTVAQIITQVRSQGDMALFELSKRFDKVALDDLRLCDKLAEETLTKIEPDVMAALEFAAERIRAYHERQKPQGFDYLDSVGVRLGSRWTAIGAVGLYVPGGTAAYPSSVLMNAIPAQVAGVERIVMVVPTPNATLNPAVIAAAKISGVKEIYTIGGAQAIAALAYGTHSIAPVDKIVGPGNAYVAEAKRQVFGQVGIDMIAGPSEIVILADGAQNPEWLAADLLSQAEHDPVAQSILISDSERLLECCHKALLRQLDVLPRADIARASWQDFGALIKVSSLDEGCALVERIAPEHLELACNNPDFWLGKVRNAGSIFLGCFTPEPIGDYVAGTNHVLPTMRSARYSSGLTVLEFMKRSSIISCDAQALEKLGDATVTLARAEGLEAHARAVEMRLSGLKIRRD